MLRFNTIYKDPSVHLITDEVKVIEVLADLPGAREIITTCERGVKDPARPPNLVYINFFHKDGVMYLLLADNKPLGLNLPGLKQANKTLLGRICLLTATSAKALMAYFTSAVQQDPQQKGIYFSIQNYLHRRMRANQIVIE